MQVYLGIQGKKLAPRLVGLPAGRPIDLGLVALDGRRHVVVIGIAGQDEPLQVTHNTPLDLKRPALPAGSHEVTLDGQGGAGELRALTPAQLKRARRQQERREPGK